MKVLIVKLSSLGDVVHAMPAVQDIRAAHPDALIDWVVEPAFAPLVRRVAGVNRVIECSLRRWRRGWWMPSVRAEWRAFRAALQQEQYDAIIDLQGYNSAEFLLQSATLTDGAFAPSITEGNQANLSDGTAVSAADLIGTIAAATFAATDDNVVKRLGYGGSKRYIRLSITATGVTTGGTMGAVALRGDPLHAPAA